MDPVTNLTPFDRVQCDSPGCFDDATVHFTRLDRRIVTEKRRVCGTHGGEVFARYWSGDVVGSGTPHELPGAVEFDLAFMFFDESTERGKLPYSICLREVGGSRRFGYRTGLYECWALNSALEPVSSPYPSTHETVRQTILSLGGQLTCVVIDDYVPVEDRYFVALRIQRAETLSIVHVRPSDAIILAVVCDVPLFVDNEAIAKLLGRGENRTGSIQ